MRSGPSPSDEKACVAGSAERMSNSSVDDDDDGGHDREYIRTHALEMVARWATLDADDRERSGCSNPTLTKVCQRF